MKKLSSWYAFMRFQESWYANMGFMHAQDVWHRDHSESYPIPSSYETISLEPTKPWNNDLHNNVTIKKIKLCLNIDLVCRNRTLGMQISKFRYANMDFFKTPRIQIWFLGKDLVFKYEFLVPSIYPWFGVREWQMGWGSRVIIRRGLVGGWMTERSQTEAELNGRA